MINRIYLSGPITTIGFEEAYKRFISAETKLKPFFEIKNPVNYGFLDGRSWEDVMRDCIRDLLICDAIIMLEGWQFSKGALLEHEIAKVLNIPILELKDIKFTEDSCSSFYFYRKLPDPNNLW